MVKWHKTDLVNRVYCNLPGGKKKAMPRYYRDRIYSNEERGFLKGEFEKQHRLKDAELIRQGKVPKRRDVEQAVLAKSRRMNINLKTVV